MQNALINGTGLGLRTAFLKELVDTNEVPFDFLELAPENWLGIGGWRAHALRKLSERFPLSAHGLSLSIGGMNPFDTRFLKQLRQFFKEYGIQQYTEHLSYCTDAQGYLYELLPLPFTEEAVRHVSSRIRYVQDYLGMRIAFENSSYYYLAAQEMSEIEFINAVIAESDCDLLLDINNLYVNSINHHYQAEDFISALPAHRIQLVHIAGHEQTGSNLLIDTHGSPVCSEVWALLQSLYQSKAAVPTLLEWDQNIPPLTELMLEVQAIKVLQANR
ncbi:hypothetical protein Lbir_0380 [Legionella birminghamensis]|uniref:Protein of uncharacterized function (DUF692) n=1 Tax=Legionella birminghamensis TaxID=28083 RepID=A0A378IKP0_9GAMM|nr:DUF692 domain-containing protein [Legionella birminghamensis]KTC75468.1 hypothetical protein Lbir_0380 [Legionella birminghamensis]STX32694.1 Protein of uncharacterised function (DUF692) [Legionella birminghamensis]